ncbi:hypothetical protein [Fumia xinanensis]|uniref:Uncharacterized protein n=1 Tax=Fumia xinanensis TaxID=2763659 RepID=A0A926E3A6_9FIRM|nr:hypothetical protein [Fumia xinanensis]MBC8559329.1 hypothetical protein [Fumia xinanensis]
MVIHHKKLWKNVSIFLAVITVINVAIQVYNARYLQYCTKINELVKGYTFSRIEIKPGVIELGNTDKNIYKAIDFPEYRKYFSISCWQEHGDTANIIIFQTGGAVDDTWGFFFINNPDFNDDLKNTLNLLPFGIYPPERLGPNVYSYSTMTPR